MIEFKNVSFIYEGTGEGKVEDLNFTVEAGECIVLTGRSGCGKTTVTRLVNGLIPDFFPGKLSGQVLVNGEDIGDKELYELAKNTGSVFQNPRTQFFNTDTDGEIAFGMENSGVPGQEMKEKVKNTAEDLHIERLLGRSIFSLSGGEKQKIAFASAYAMNPDIYLLDEPSSNLDMDSIEDLRQHIALLKKQGKTILIAEHRLYYLRNLADRIFYLDKGKLRYIWTGQEFLNLSEKERKGLGLRAAEYIEPPLGAAGNLPLGGAGKISLRASEKIPLGVAGKKETAGERREFQKENAAGVHGLSESEEVKAGNFFLEVRNLSVGYGKETVLSNLNFQAKAGEIIAITGHNGAGKSTLCRTLCGLKKPLAGSIFWNGRPCREKERLKNSYMVMQDVNYQLFADSVEHECGFGIQSPDRERIAETMKQLDLYEYKDRHPNTLSGGQKQRVAVAVSMICRKDILIFDEPTSGLDYESMCAVAELMKELAGMGKLIFVVTHDFELMELACTRELHLFPETDKAVSCDRI